MAETNLIYKVESDVEIHVENIGGDVVLQGHEEAEIRARGEGVTVMLEEGGQRATINSDGDCRLWVPNGASLKIENLGGDAKITDLHDEIHIENAGSDLVIRDTGAVFIESIGSDAELKRINGDAQVGSVGSDLSVREVNGSLRIESIGSDASIRDVNGDLNIESVGSDAVLIDVDGDCTIESVGSDLVLDTEIRLHHNYRFESIGGDFRLKIDPEASVHIVVPHGTERQIEVRGVSVESDGDLDTIRVGEGVAEIQVESIEGTLQLVPRGRGFPENIVENIVENFVPEDLDEMISSRINQHWEHIQERLNRETERLQQEAERAAERTREKAERLAEKARQSAERMQREAERAAEKASSKRGKRGFRWEFSFGGPGRRDGFPFRPPAPPPAPPPPRPPRPVEPVSDQERLAILRMVEAKQITVEEAERLLAALEGRK